MNPYEQPSFTSVSEQCLEQWGTPGFEDCFLTEIVENKALPLEGLCSSGNYPSPQDTPECTGLVIRGKADGIATGHFFVSFTEDSPTGCRDMQWHSAVSGRIDFTLNLTDGTITFEPPRYSREYESDEF